MGYACTGCSQIKEKEFPTRIINLNEIMDIQ